MRHRECYGELVEQLFGTPLGHGIVEVRVLPSGQVVLLLLVGVVRVVGGGEVVHEEGVDLLARVRVVGVRGPEVVVVVVVAARVPRDARTIPEMNPRLTWNMELFSNGEIRNFPLKILKSG